MDAFALFDVDSAELEQLRNLFSFGSLANLQDPFSIIDDFKAIIGIEEKRSAIEKKSSQFYI